MDMASDDHGEAASWSLSTADLALVAGKSRANRVSFGVLLAFCRATGRFPGVGEAPDPAAVAHIARQAGGSELGAGDAPDRTLKRHRAEIRASLGLREATVADAEMLGGWLSDQVVARSRDGARLSAELEQRYRELSIEPPTPERIDRIVRAAVRAYEDRLYAAVHVRLTPSHAQRAGRAAATGPSRRRNRRRGRSRGRPDGRAARVPAGRCRPCQRQQPAGGTRPPHCRPSHRPSRRLVQPMESAGTGGMPATRRGGGALRAAPATPLQSASTARSRKWASGYATGTPSRSTRGHQRLTGHVPRPLGPSAPAVDRSLPVPCG